MIKAYKILIAIETGLLLSFIIDSLWLGVGMMIVAIIIAYKGLIEERKYKDDTNR